ncbi:chitotriosidase-1 [Culex quinquefasciatus]|uniref:chitotriosidase-1 n=1 Tax=Culex quinquefasciatus TaxID=7176 RepID=UPI0018E3C60B|nr:chitotriosidase-1 [Culex quinquefasciatus]
MQSILFLISLVILHKILIVESQACKQKPYNVVCYLASWSVYREGRGSFNVSYVIPTYCTHLVYTFAGLGLNGGLDSLDHYNDINVNKGYERIVGLKEENPCLKVMLAVGGWNEGSEKYSLMAETEESRMDFADHALKYLAHFGFDGLDLDWEYPTMRGGIPEDKENFILLLKTLRDKFQRRKKLLSVAIGGSPGIIQAAYDLTAMCEVLDFINLMAYDYGLKNIASVDAPLYPEPTTKSESADGAIAFIRQSGCPMSKINLGIPTRAKTYTLRTGVKGDLRTGIAVQGPGRAGPYTKNAGTLGYNELCEMVKEGKWDTKLLNNVKVKVGFHGDQWVTYDDGETTTAKAMYAKEKGLGGVMFWTIDTDDYHGDCHNEAYPMVRAANRVFGYIR